MKLKFDFGNMFTSGVLTRETLEKDSEKILRAYKAVNDNFGKGWQQWCELPYIDLPQIEEYVTYGKEIAENNDSFVVFGIGGSALGAIAVSNALSNFHHNELDRNKRKSPKLYIEDNIDPERMAALFDVIDLSKTHFNVITKSGSTSETLAQFMIICNRLKACVGEEFKKHITVTTTIGKGALYDAAIKMGVKAFGIPEYVGGRFSVLSSVGLLTFAVMGYDIKALLKGATTMTEAAKNGSILSNPALVAAYFMTEYLRKGKNISVMMPYSDKLKYFADFYCQLWGESLGKAVNNKGEKVNCGQTPVKALGVTDQHSQVQLYTEGPYDKVFTIIGVENFACDVTIPKCNELTGYDFLAGHSLGELLNYERDATRIAITESGKPNFTILLEKVDEENLGELLCFFMYETAFAGAFLDINTFDQPGVEYGKKATFAMLNRPGYEEMKNILTRKEKNKFLIPDKE